MPIKLITVLSLVILFSSCKKNQESTSTDTIAENKSTELTAKDISNIKFIDYALDQKTEMAIQDWIEYTQLNDEISNIKKGNLSFFNDNEKAIKLLMKDLKQNIPEPVYSPSILARILVLETKFYKLESLSNLSTTSKEELLEAIKEFFVSFSNLNLQMNKKIEFDSRIIEKP